MKTVAILTGAGISAESGIKTFRDENGLWEEHDIMEIASPQGWKNNPKKVLDFYNARRRQLHRTTPNRAHRALVKLEDTYTVEIITQNVDDLHERAGSQSVTHLHGELFKVRSTLNPELILDWKKDLHQGDLGADKAQLRPHVVWFDEPVPELRKAEKLVKSADFLIIIGTSMQVYPAAGLVNYIASNHPVYYIDPRPNMEETENIHIIPKKASIGVPELVEKLIF